MSRNRHGLRSRLQQAVQQGRAGGLVLQIRQHHHKLITAQTGQRVTFSHHLLHVVRQGHQHLVANRMTIPVIDGLEAVEVQVAHGDGRPMATGLNQALPEPVRQQNAVGQVGQGVKVRHALQLNLLRLEFGDVGVHGHVLKRLPLLVQNHADGLQRGVQLAVLVPVPDFAMPVALGEQLAPHAGVKRVVLAT